MTKLTTFDKRGLEIKRKALENDLSQTADKLKETLKRHSTLSEEAEIAATVKDFSIVLSTDEDIKLSIELLKE